MRKPLPICNMCEYYKAGAGESDGVSKCVAFPEGIPNEIRDGFDHREPLGNENTLFERAEWVTDEDIAVWEENQLNAAKGDMLYNEHKSDEAIVPEEDEFLPE